MPDLELDDALRALRAPSRSEHGDGGTDGLPAIRAAADRRRRRDGAVWVATGAAAVLIVAAVATISLLRSDEVGVATPPDQRPGIVFAVFGAATPNHVDRAANIVGRRLVAAGVADPAVTVEDGGIVVRGTGPADADLLSRAVQPSAVAFRPVQRLLPPTAPATPAADLHRETIRLPDIASAVPPAVLVLGPGLDGSVVESARAAEGINGRWFVNLVLWPGEDGIERFNELARTCAGKALSCAERRLAVVVEGVVVSAPTINTWEFQRDHIEISGDFTQAEAESLADVLSLGSLPVTLVPR